MGNLSRKTKKLDLAIIGAGAAGLAAAQSLKSQGIHFKTFEARHRLGGRIHSLIDPLAEVAIEYGPEFIHGAQAEMFELLRSQGQSFYDVTDNHHFVQGQSLRTKPNFFDEMGDLMPSLKSKDQSIADFLTSKKKIDSQKKSLFKSFIEGFHAADPEKMGTRALAVAEQTEEPELNGVSNFRPLAGYEHLILAMGKELIQDDRVQLNSVLREIHCAPNDVRLIFESKLSGQLEEVRAKKVLITLPVGVLKSSDGNLKFDPMPKILKEALENSEMGHVQKLNFIFKERFWEKLGTKEPISYLHLENKFAFPTWWTTHPVRSSHLVAWQGGPRAEVMQSWSKAQLVDTAIGTLSKWARLSKDELFNLIESCEHHNWSKDPYCLGAYSYGGVGGAEAPARLAKPIHNTLFFAGEFLATGAGRGTVHGAMETGRQAAALIVKSGF